MNIEKKEIIWEIRLDEIEAAAAHEEEYQAVAKTLCGAFKKLKEIVGNNGWLALDEYISAKNAEAEYMIRYAYIDGLRNGEN